MDLVASRRFEESHAASMRAEEGVGNGVRAIAAEEDPAEEGKDEAAEAEDMAE